jgi:hypothetical protein
MADDAMLHPLARWFVVTAQSGRKVVDIFESAGWAAALSAYRQRRALGLYPADSAVREAGESEIPPARAPLENRTA